LYLKVAAHHPMHTPCLTDFALDFVFLMHHHYLLQDMNIKFFSLSLSLSLSHTYKTIFHTVFGPEIWALTLCYASRHDLLNSTDPTHSVLMIATNQNANANWRWRKKIIYQFLEAKDWRSILLIMQKEVQGIMICTHTRTRPPHAFSISPGDKWWQTV
jgi:hypothetical protein